MRLPLAARYMLLVPFLAALAGCFSPASPPSEEFRSMSDGGADSTTCPDLGGTYRLVAGSAEARYFSPELGPAARMDMVQLTASGERWFRYRVKPDEAAFLAAVDALRVADAEGWAQWQQLLGRWLVAVERKDELSVIERDMLLHGPLPEGQGLITPRSCLDGWALIKHGTRVGERSDSGEAKVWDTELWLGKSAAGALLFRYDEFSTVGIIFNSSMRTGLSGSRFGKLDPAPAAAFVWSVDRKLLHTPSVAAMRRAELPGLLVDIQQHLEFHQPAGTTVSYFAADSATTAALAQGDATLAKVPFDIEIRGTVSHSADVNMVLRALAEHTGVERVELTSVRHVDAEHIEFGMRARLKSRVR